MLCCVGSQWVLGKEMRREHEEAEGILCSYQEEDCKGNPCSLPATLNWETDSRDKYMTATLVSDAAQGSLRKASLKFRVHT